MREPAVGTESACTLGGVVESTGFLTLGGVLVLLVRAVCGHFTVCIVVSKGM